jgi:hypothetical protein
MCGNDAPARRGKPQLVVVIRSFCALLWLWTWLPARRADEPTQIP